MVGKNLKIIYNNMYLHLNSEFTINCFRKAFFIEKDLGLQESRKVCWLPNILIVNSIFLYKRRKVLKIYFLLQSIHYLRLSENGMLFNEQENFVALTLLPSWTYAIHERKICFLPKLLPNIWNFMETIYI